MNKPPVLSDEFWENLKQTILDGRKDYYQEVKNILSVIRPIIEQQVQQARQETAREIKEELEKASRLQDSMVLNHYAFEYPAWQAFWDKHLKG